MRGSSRWVTVLGLAALAVLVGNTALSSYNVNVLIANDEGVARTIQTRRELSGLLSDMKDAETGHRGFLITGRDDSLRPYTEALARLPGRREWLVRHLADDADQFNRLAALDAAVDLRLSDLARTLAVGRARGADAARAAVADGPDKRLMDDVRDRVAALVAREEARLAERQEVVRGKYRATVLTNLLGGAVALLVAVGAYLAVGRELGRRRLAEADARLAGDALAASQKDQAAALAELGAFLDHAPVGIAFYDSGLRYRRINRFLADANKRPVGDHIGRHTRDLMPDFPDDLLTDYGRVLDTGEPVLNRRVVFSTGQGPAAGVTWELNLFPVPDPAGGKRGLGVFAQDVSERAAAEGRLAASEARFRTLADTVPQLVWVARPDGVSEFFNSRWYAYTGLTAEECVGRERVAPVHPDDAAAARAGWRHSLATGEPFDMEYRMRGASGEYRWFLGSARAVRDGGAKVERWFGTCTDIDDQKRMAADARASEARFRTLAAAVPGFITTFAPDGEFEFVNDWFTEYTGRGLGAVARGGWADLVHPDDRPAAEAAFARALSTGEELATEARVRAADGSYRWYGTRALPVRDDAGAVARWHAISVDIDPQKRAVDDVRASEARLRTLADAMPQIVFAAAPDGTLDYYNERWYQYTGRPRGESGDASWAPVVHPDDLSRVAGGWRASVRTGQPYQDEFRVWNAHAGAFRWHLTRADPTRDETGAVARWYGTSTDVHDNRELTARLAESEARFRTLADVMPQIVFTAEPDGAVDYFNDRWYQYTGQARGSESFARWGEVIHPDDLARTVAEWSDATRTGTVYDIEYRFRDGTTGEYRWHLGRAMPVRDADNRVVRWCGTCTDIDDQKTFAARLARSEARFRSLSEAVPGFVWSATPDGALDYQNSRVAEYHGAAAPDGVATRLEIVHPADRERATAAWRRSLVTGDPYRVEYRLRRHDGAYRWFVAQALPAKNPDGSIEHWYGTSTDVDDSKAAALRAEVSAERFRLLTESIPQMVWNADAAGRATYFNTKWRDYTGMDQTAAVSDWWGQVLHPADAPAARAAWNRAVAGAPEAMTWEVRVRRAADRQYRWFLTAVVPLRRPDGSVDQWIGSLSDIDDQKRQSERLEQMVKAQTATLIETNESLRAEVTERLRAEQRERAAAVELRRSNAELEKFAYVASHDLQEPLRKIQAFGDRLGQKFKDQVGETGKDYIDRMQSSAGRMRVLINDLLTFSRVSTRNQPFVPVDLNAVLDDVLDNLEVRLNESGGRVEVGELPTVPGDPTQMRQLFQNLVGNALKFRRPDVPPVVTITATPTHTLPADPDPPVLADGARITVADNGIGFEQTYAEKIFDVFQRLHGRGEYEGTGIGLAICRKIVERHGGGVAARGTPGAGAVFALDLPTRPTAGGAGPSSAGDAGT